MKYDVDAMQPGTPYSVDEERLWLVDQTRLLFGKCCRLLDEMRGSERGQDGILPLASSPTVATDAPRS